MNSLVELGATELDIQALKQVFGDDNADLKQGVLPSFAALSVKGKVWRMTYKGETKIIKDRNGDPVPYLPVVVVKASPNISKLFYEKTYQEGDDQAPDCFSLNGVVPDPASDKVQSKTCAACPKNVYGSKITENGSKAKACADSRRICVVPYPDIENAVYGGPMLLRVPPTSLQELVKYADQLSNVGAPYQGVITRIGFDPEPAYPKLQFRALKALTRDEATIIRKHMDGDQVHRMLELDGLPVTDSHEAAPQGLDNDAGPATKKSAPDDGGTAAKAAAEAAAKAKAAVEAEKRKAAETAAVVGFDLSFSGDNASSKPIAEETTRVSPAQQATAAAAEVGGELDSMIANLLA